ncbi:hypothetical protein HUT18_11155 [Streptomyces sp. NA04227]|uniref:hypothetical protein n=1 Tax=Streptomyces sp. NA04227 TaxID=2742136 RepID=UPI0015903595|nr:hypothetical protein [Streptomyces sp. NA04227]QKW06866.1 hypothetical protein HUT18_11155 [Streptomyces sp. NA04227]
MPSRRRGFRGGGNSDHLPVALGGGWQGYTDFSDTGVVLTCAGRPASLVVSVNADEPEADAVQTRKVARKLPE